MGDRPNPSKGRSIVHQNPLLVHTKEDLRRAVEVTFQTARRCVFQELGITELNSPSTPSSRWFVEGEADYHPDLINRDRGNLMLGDHTDDELANEVFLYGDMSADDKHRAIMSGKPSSIAYLTAGKERIRWLSRHLEGSLANEKVLCEQLVSYDEKIWNFLVCDHVQQRQGLLFTDEGDTALNDSDDSFMSKALQLLLRNFIERKVKEAYEVVAQKTYERWADHDGYTPWVAEGNSFMQGKARKMVSHYKLAYIFSEVLEKQSVAGE